MRERRKTRERRQKEARVIGRGRWRRRGFHGDGEHLPSFLVPRSCRPAAGHRLAAAADVSPGPERIRPRKKRHGRAAKDEDNEYLCERPRWDKFHEGRYRLIEGGHVVDPREQMFRPGGSLSSLSLRSSTFCSPLAPLKLTLPPPRANRANVPLNKARRF